MSTFRELEAQLKLQHVVIPAKRRPVEKVLWGKANEWMQKLEQRDEWKPTPVGPGGEV